MRHYFILIVSLISLTLYAQKDNSALGKALIEKMVEKVGNYDYLKQLNDVKFKYSFYSPKADAYDISTEYYIFKDETSYAKYKTHNIFVLPKQKGVVKQYFNGKDTTKITLNDKEIGDKAIIAQARFLRKANYYWFAMMPKLLDDGLIYEQLSDRTVNNIVYQIVKVGFKNSIGDVQDNFVLYINPKTHLVDQFLFTVKATKLPEVLLMKAKYNTVEGYTFMAKRDVYVADWDGNTKALLYTQITTDVVFNNGFKKETFLKE